ncbi:hypothetical protein HN425_02780 [Candidatus Woesearchaeota archaeon]|nr:hypothetical protein [Candidatus Woesearchaeota archaeon]MBT7169996.1 hypothetical protein [Candidatus Woesearchaeota archaeon]
MKSKKIIVAMSTKYNLKNESDRIRLKLCIQTLNNCKKRKIYAVVIETSRDIKVSNKLKNLTTILIRKKGISMGEGRRMAIRNAKKAGAEIIILLDPEKEDFIKSINKITDYLIKKDYDIIIPERKNFKGYPKFQEHLEKIGNEFWEKITKTELDMWFGTRVFKKEVANYFLDYKGEYGDLWDINNIPIMRAIKEKKKVGSIRVNFRYPKTQRDIEKENPTFLRKRIKQLDFLTKCIYEENEK